MSESLDEPVRAELVEQPQPPLSISHLLLWILGSAAVLGSYRWLGEPHDSEPVRKLLFDFDQIVRGLTVGAGIAALLVFARRTFTRSGPLANQPGHWLLVAHGFVWPAYWVALFTLYGLRGMPRAPAGDAGLAIQFAMANILYYLWAAIPYGLALAWLREPRRWRVYFAVSTVLPLLHALLWCCVSIDSIVGLTERWFLLLRIAVMLPFLAICVLRDRAATIRRDWMHVAGVGVHILGSLWYLGVYVAHLFLPR